jgi:signal transduction histidine kinase
MKNEQVNTIRREHELMSETLANISHQLKTPLTSMMIMADLLEEAPPHKQKEFVVNIKKELNHTQWLVSTLLKMAKLDAKATEFTPVIVPSEELINLAIEPLQILLEVKNQRIEITGKDTFLCDKKWTAEALTNVIKNALEHSPDDSVIKIKVGGNPICKWIGVTDEGGGISKTGQKHIFKRFEGGRSEKGYGIGLPLSLAIMKGQNGDIEVEGDGEHRGATFILKFYK